MLISPDGPERNLGLELNVCSFLFWRRQDSMRVFLFYINIASGQGRHKYFQEMSAGSSLVI